MASARREGTRPAPRVPGTPFEYLHHLVTVPVLVDGDVESRFVLDTGIGLTLVSRALAARLGLEPDGSHFTGRRMSGHEVTLPLASIRAMSLGTLTRERHTVGILDVDGFPEELRALGGFLSLAFFDDAPFTVDYPRQVVAIESECSLAERAKEGTAVDVRVRRDGPAVDVFLPVSLPNGRSIEAEVDMGSSALILDERLAAGLGIRLDGPAVRRVEGEDETGGRYTRCFTTLEGDVHPRYAPAIRQSSPDVMFQRIVHDGLVGGDFLRRFRVTYDIGRGRVIFTPYADGDAGYVGT